MDRKLHDLLHHLADKTAQCKKCNAEREEIITQLYIRMEELGGNNVNLQETGSKQGVNKSNRP